MSAKRRAKEPRRGPRYEEADPYAHMDPGITHGSNGHGYPRCGAIERPIDVWEDYLGDATTGQGDEDCPACLALKPGQLGLFDAPGVARKGEVL